MKQRDCLQGTHFHLVKGKPSKIENQSPCFKQNEWDLRGALSPMSYELHLICLKSIEWVKEFERTENDN